MAARDGAALSRLAAEAQRLSLPARSLVLLASALSRKEARALLRWAQGRHPADYYIPYDLGTLLAKMNLLEINKGAAPADLEEAVGCLRVAVALRPDATTAYTHLGVALSHKLQWHDAIAAFKKAIKLDPTNNVAPNNLAMTYSSLGAAMAAKSQRDDAIAAYNDAIAAYKKVIKIRPKDAAAYINLGIALAAKGQRDDAIAAYEKAIKIDPKHAVAYINLGIALAAKGQRDDAIAAYKKAIKLDRKQATAHYGLGNALLAKGQWDDAIAAYKKAIELNPKYAWAYNNLGNALSAKDQRDDAIAAYKEAIKLDTKFAVAYNNLGNTLSAQGRRDEAFAAYKKAIELNPNFARLHLGRACQGWAGGSSRPVAVRFQKQAGGPRCLVRLCGAVPVSWRGRRVPPSSPGAARALRQHHRPGHCRARCAAPA